MQGSVASRDTLLDTFVAFSFFVPVLHIWYMFIFTATEEPGTNDASGFFMPEHAVGRKGDGPCEPMDREGAPAT